MNWEQLAKHSVEQLKEMTSLVQRLKEANEELMERCNILIEAVEKRDIASIRMHLSEREN